jgi:ribosome-binding factor A
MLLRTVPELHFIYDASIDRGMRLSKLIDEALAPENLVKEKAPETKAPKTKASNTKAPKI